MPKLHVLIEIARTPPIAAFELGAAPVLPVLPKLRAEIDESFGTVPVRPTPENGPQPFAEADQKAMTSIIRATVADNQLEDIRNANGVIQVYSDPIVASFGCGCRSTDTVPRSSGGMSVCGQLDCSPGTPRGGQNEVAAALGVQVIWDTGFRGQGIVIGIVDGGVDADRYPVIGGWSPLLESPPGRATHWGGHGNMCAFDALIAAPGAKIYDLGIGKSSGGITAFLSSALQAFHWALLQYQKDGTPQVLSNSWGLFQDSWDPLPPGDPGNYTHNPHHPFTRKVEEAIDRGILVSFAAGNCGDSCPDGRCGPDHGEGHSIRGANGHKRVICVAAVNIHHQRAGYSSEGPSTLDQMKPDICGYTHFAGHFPSDSGTSAACPVVAGVLGLLRSACSELRQDEVRAALNSTAINICAPGFDRQSGFGVVNPPAAYHHLGCGPNSALVPARLARILHEKGWLPEVLDALRA